jgi:4-carboxymuconolactone decarboxylase
MGAEAGLTAAQLDAIPSGPAAAVWTPFETALLTAVDEMIDDHAIGDATWASLASRFGPAEMFELLFVVGGYLCLAAVLNSIGLQGGLPTVTQGDDGAVNRGSGGGAAAP